MAQSKIKQNQLALSTNPGSLIVSDSSNIFAIKSPSTGADHLWFYDHSATDTVPLTLGTNLSISGTTLNATAGAGGYATVQEEGSTVGASNTTINFIGSGITAADAGSGVTSVTINTFLNTLATAGNINLATVVTGVLPVANGGTGANTLTGLLQGNGTSAVTAISNSSTVGQVLRVTGTSTYAWGALDLSDTDAITGDLPYGNLAQLAGLSVLGKAGTGLGDVAAITASVGGQILRHDGTNLSFGAITLSNAASVTGVLAISNGGTGSATQNFVDLSNTQTIDGAKTFSSNITINGTPSANTDAATVGWVLNNVAGLKSGSARGATASILTATAQTSTTITLGGTSFTHDGVTYANDETILVKDSVTGGSGGTFNNGVYKVGGVGTSVVLTRVDWMNTAGEIDGVYVLIQDGSTNAGTLWFTVSEVTTLGTDAISFTQITTSGTMGGTASANKVAFGSGPNTLTSDTNFHFESGQLLIGTATLETSNKLTTKGAGTGGTTFGYRHLDSGNTKVFSVADNGTIVIGSTNPLTIANNELSRAEDIDINSTSATTSIRLFNTGSTSTAGNVVEINPTVNKNHTSGSHVELSTLGSYTVGTGTGNFTGFRFGNTINQSGGTGIVRGIHINPTLTAAQDFRGVEITASATQYALWTTAGKVRFDLGSDAQGDLLVRGSGGNLERLAAGSTAGHVLTSNGAGAAPSYQAAAGGATVTRAYKTGATTDTFDLDSGTAVTDIDGTNVAFTTSGISADKIFVVRNGVTLSQSGTVTRDYTLNTSTGVLVLAYAMTSDENLMVYKIV